VSCTTSCMMTMELYATLRCMTCCLGCCGCMLCCVDHPIIAFAWQDGATALIIAAEQGHTSVVAQLLGAPGISVDAAKKVSALEVRSTCVRCTMPW
jgi:hypothetical protein